MDSQYTVFVSVVGALGILVVAATFVERMLAFVFEHEWFVRLLTHEKPDPADETKTLRVSKLPGLKGLIALGVSLAISFKYEFDVLHILFATDGKDPIGQILTGFVIAGGSAGAIAIFQGYLNIDKQSRDAIIAARKAEAESAKQVAELAIKEAEAKQKKAEAEKKEAELRMKIAEVAAK